LRKTRRRGPRSRNGWDWPKAGSVVTATQVSGAVSGRAPRPPRSERRPFGPVRRPRRVGRPARQAPRACHDRQDDRRRIGGGSAWCLQRGPEHLPACGGGIAGGLSSCCPDLGAAACVRSEFGLASLRRGCNGWAARQGGFSGVRRTPAIRGFVVAGRDDCKTKQRTGSSRSLKQGAFLLSPPGPRFSGLCVREQ